MRALLKPSLAVAAAFKSPSCKHPLRLPLSDALSERLLTSPAWERRHPPAKAGAVCNPPGISDPDTETAYSAGISASPDFFTLDFRAGFSSFTAAPNRTDRASVRSAAPLRA